MRPIQRLRVTVAGLNVLPLLALCLALAPTPALAQGLQFVQPTNTVGQSNDREEIARLYRDLTDAFAHRDSKALERLFGDDYTIVSERGRIMVREYFIQSRGGLGPVAQISHFDDLAIRLYGSTAIVTSRYTGSLSDAANAERVACPQRDLGATRTDSWIKRDGRWQLVATQLSSVGFPGASQASASATICGFNADDLSWTDSPQAPNVAVFPSFPGARIAPLSGHAYTGPYVVRMQRPDGHIEQPHRHESDEAVTVLSGIVHIGLGDQIDRTSAKTFGPGAYVMIPARTVHYSWAEGTVVEEISWSGSAESTAAQKEISLPRATLAAYVGTYRFTPVNMTLTITLDDGQLMGQRSGAWAPFPLYPESETRFFLKTAPQGSGVGVNATLEFVKSQSGEVMGMLLNGRGQGTRVSQ